MQTTYKIKCLRGFRDGMVLPEAVPPGKVLEVDGVLWNKIRKSDPDAFEVVDSVMRVPPPTKGTKDD